MWIFNDFNKFWLKTGILAQKFVKTATVSRSEKMSLSRANARQIYPIIKTYAKSADPACKNKWHRVKSEHSSKIIKR